MGFFLVIKAELVRSWIMMRRYWFATVLGIIMTYGILILGIGSIASYGGGKINTFIASEKALGFLLGTFAFGILGMFTQNLRSMARTGQLEQVCMSPHGLVTNFLARTTVTAFMSFFSMSIVYILVTYSLDIVIHVDLLAVVVLMVLTCIGVIGLGFMCGGLVLVFKNTGQLLMLVRFLVLGMPIAATKNIDNWSVPLQWVAHIVPSTDAAICLKYVLVEGQINSHGVFESFHRHPSFFILIVNASIWTFVGIALFQAMENWSRDKGTLGAY